MSARRPAPGRGPVAPRAALYARVSTVGHGQDVALQLEELRAAAAQRGWVVVGEYVDDGISGARTRRPALDRLLGDAQAGKTDVVFVWKLDRLARSLVHLLQVLDELAGWGVGFAALRNPGIDTTGPAGRLLLQILGAFAEYERELTRERVVAGVRRAKAQGKHCGRPRRHVDLRPAQALLDQGRSVREVAGILGIPRMTLARRLREALPSSNT